MPLENGQYVAPTFVNGSAPALNASEMNALAGAAAGAVEYDRDQTEALTAAQQQVARTNIAAVACDTYTVTLSSAGWAGSAAPYTQTVNVAGISATDNLVVGLAASNTAAQYVAFANSGVICTEQSNGSLTFSAMIAKPTANIVMAVAAIHS